jgi:hypothetical protein
MSIQTLRKLHIDFEEHTYGDADFKVELLTEMVKNVKELAQSLPDSLSKNDYQIFARACHKAKVTLFILNDEEYTSIVATLQRALANQNLDDIFNHCAQRFAQASEQIVTSLDEEITAAI